MFGGICIVLAQFFVQINLRAFFDHDDLIAFLDAIQIVADGFEVLIRAFGEFAIV